MSFKGTKRIVYDVDLPGEEWRPVVGLEGKYEVSNKGRIKSLLKYKRDYDAILRPCVDKLVYRRFVLTNGPDIRIKKLAHRAVAEAFIPNPNMYPEVDHINAVPGDDRVENLRWVTRSMNQLNEITRKRLSKARTGKVFSEESKMKMSLSHKGMKYNLKHISNNTLKLIPVVMIDSSGNYVCAFSSIKEAGEVLGKNSKRISSNLSRGYKHKDGVSWKRI